MHLQAPLAADPRSSTERQFVVSFALMGILIALALVHELLERAGVIPDEMGRAASETELGLHLLLFAIVCAAFPLFIREMRRRQATAVNAQDSRAQLALLFRMTDMLQSALGHGDANVVLRSTASSLMPGFGGALYIFNNSGDRLELSTSWQWGDPAGLPPTISPSDCWSIKRGKQQNNLIDDDALRCAHHETSTLATMEIPMMARGEIYGLLIVARDGPDAAAELDMISGVANALSDAMSLSLSNLALRERLRTQALRDALTGLYNRRYMEDALQRHADQASRTNSPLSLVMIDLDNFKRLNDEHGHAMGDAVLSEVASAILGAIRPCDVACRYGGEELLALLPDCSLDDAAACAEVLRSRIERLGERHGAAISASFGVATIPESSNSKDALADADRALYRAKQEGRNRVIASAPIVREADSRNRIAA